MAHQVPDFWAALFERWRKSHGIELERLGIVDVVALAPDGDVGNVDVYFVKAAGNGYSSYRHRLTDLFTPPKQDGATSDWIEALVRPLLYRHKNTASEDSAFGADAAIALSQLEGRLEDVWKLLADADCRWNNSGRRTTWARTIIERVQGRFSADRLVRDIRILSIVEPETPEDTALVSMHGNGRDFNLAFRDITDDLLETKLPILVVERNDHGTVSYMNNCNRIMDIVSDTLLKLTRVEEATTGAVIRRGTAGAISEALRFMYGSVASTWVERDWKKEVEQAKQDIKAEYYFFDDGYWCNHTVAWHDGDGVLALAMSLQHSTVLGARVGEAYPDMSVGISVGNYEHQSSRQMRAGDVDWADALSKAGARLLRNEEF